MFSGLIWGTVVAGLGAGGLSLAYPDFKPADLDVANTAAAPEAVVEEAMEAPAAVAEDVSAASEDAVEQSMEQAADEVAEADVVEEAVAALAEEVAVAEPVEAEVLLETASDPAEPEQTQADVADESAVADDAAAPAESTADDEVFDPESEPEEVDTTEADAPVEPEPAAEPEQSETEEVVAALPEPSGTVGDLAPEVTTNRLPSVTDEAPSEEPAESPVEEESAVAPSPIERFAAPFEAEEGKPLMSIVLIDEGDDELGVEALAAFPYPITFAVDASATNAAERMQIFRDKGFEVMALAGLPLGANASDAEIAMSAYMSAVPEAVAFLETPDISLQGSRELTDQITKIVQESGHGLVLQANGLNTAQKLASREGVPAATIFRDFDGKDQKAGVIRRFLDQAAFKAGQEGGVIMLGRLRAETISALLIWGLADRASRVALVPVSAVLQQDAAN